MPDFLLELLSEEIPARMQPEAARQLGERFAALLAEAGLAAETVETFATPRRLALLARGLPAASEPVTEERRGPRADAPEAAIAGFLKSTGLARDQLEARETDKGRFLFAVLHRDGRPAAELLAERLPAMIEGIHWPKSMRWGDASASTASPRWVRPLRGIVALLDREVVSFAALGVEAGRETVGHRFMSGGAIAIDGAGTYRDQLHAAFVVLSAGERQALIRASAEAAAHRAGLQLRPDEGLEIENAGLTEWPVALLGRFDPAFLEVPREIIELTMRTNQKYFACEAADGSLAPAFVCLANLEAADGGRTIVAGNERVLSARLADARFFWAQDRAKRLEEHAENLAGIVFHEKLGTIAEKVERVARLARWLVETHPGQFPGATPDLVERAARLARADLVTGTVGEFPELQGIIGGHLAEAQGEPPEIVAAIRQHYAPVPEGPVAVAVALADRLDTLARFFDADLRPTGSKDPFALRRAALSVIEMILGGELRLPIDALLASAGAGSAADIRSFLADRLKVREREAGVRHDLIDAVFALGHEDDLVRLVARVKALQAFIETEDGANLLSGYRRAANILKAEDKKDGPHAFDPALPLSAYAQEAERDLAARFVPAGASSATLLFDEVDELLAAEDFAGAMRRLATLRAPVDRFFEAVTVNDPDADVRRRRLGLCAAIRDAMHRVADFSRIEG
ncbi:MAG: glycine--tRNA ligase subunit beta [Sphingomonadaceae bacterium]